MKPFAGVSPELVRRIGRQVGRCAQQWNLLEDGDRVLVGMSGGKDSFALLHALMRSQRVAPIRFELVPFHLNHGHPEFPGVGIVDYVRQLGLKCEVAHQDTKSVLEAKLEPGHSPCSLCSRLRRGIIYTKAKELGCTKVALGHHRDDAIETLLLSVFYSGQMKSMPARLVADDGENVVIRPLLYVPEAWLVEVNRQARFPILDGSYCGFTPDQQKRQEMKELLNRLCAENPNVRGNAFAALRNVVPSHLLDPKLLKT